MVCAGEWTLEGLRVADGRCAFRTRLALFENIEKCGAFGVTHATEYGEQLAFLLAPPKEVAIVGAPDAGDTKALIDAAREGYRPDQVVAFAAPGAPSGSASGSDRDEIPLLAGKTTIDGRAAAYVCRAFTCAAPVTAPDDLRRQLEEA